MEYEKLPEKIQTQKDKLKHRAQKIQSDVLDAIESAENLEEFRSLADRNIEKVD